MAVFFRRPFACARRGKRPSENVSDAVHGVEEFFVLHADVQREAFARLGEDFEHFFAALRAFGGVDEDDHGEVVVHQLLADVEDVDLVFGQEFGHVVNDADAVFADNGEDGAG